MVSILHLHPTFRVGSGIDEVVRNLMKYTTHHGCHSELACFDAEDIMVNDVKPLRVMVCSRPKYVALIDNSFGLFPVPSGKLLVNLTSSLFSTYRPIRKRINEVDIIHAHFYPMNAFSSLIKPKDKKLVIHNYGVTNNTVGLSTFGKKKLSGAKKSEYLFSAADVVISISDYLRKNLLESTGVDSIVVPPGIDINHYYYSAVGRDAIRSKYDIAEDAYVILFVGRLMPYKRVDLLISSFNIVKKKLSNSKLIIVPSPYCDGSVFDVQVKKLGLEKEVIFAKNVSFENMPSYYSACDTNASCSVWEGFGLPFIEAAACGRPSVGFAGIPGLEVLAKNGLGLRVEHKSAEGFAEKLLEARSKSWDSQKLRDFSTGFSWDIMAKRVVDIYFNLM